MGAPEEPQKSHEVCAGEITVQLDPDDPSLVMTLEAPPSGATVRWVKEELCRQDPTGSTQPCDFCLCTASKQPPDPHLAASPAPLADDVLLTPGLAALILSDCSLAAGASSPDPNSVDGGVAGDCEEEAAASEWQLYSAVGCGDVDEVRRLLQASPPELASQPLPDGRTPLNAAVELLGTASPEVPSVKLPELLDALLEARADPNGESTPLRETPLHIALHGVVALPVEDLAAGLDVLRTLLRARADPNRPDDFGETPLFEAACSGSAEACRVLLEHGAVAAQLNVNGNCALDLATEDEVRQILEEAARGIGTANVHERATTASAAREDEGTSGLPAVERQYVGFDFDDLEETEEKFRDLRRTPPGAAEERAGARSRPEQLHEKQPELVTAPSNSGLPTQTLRERGNEHFKAARYKEAKTLYSEALLSEPGNAGILSNRAAASLMLKDWEAAFQDSYKAVRLDPANVKACERCARSLLLTNRLAEALQLCKQRIQNLLPQQQQSPEWRPVVELAPRIQHHAGILHRMEQVLADPRQAESEGPAGSVVQGVQEMQNLLSEREYVSPFGERLSFTKVRALLHPIPGTSGQSVETRRQWTGSGLVEMDKLLKEKYEWPDTHHWRARCLVRLGRRKDAREALKEAMRIAQKLGGQHLITEQLLDSLAITETEKERGNTAFKHKDWRAALAAYDAAVVADAGRWDVEFSAQLHCNRSSARSKAGLMKEAMEDANAALSLRPDYCKALFRRGLLLMEAQRYDQALLDFEHVARLEPGFAGLSEWLPRARSWSHQAPEKNYYAVLGVRADATPAEIKKAYKVAALKWHPDKNRDDLQRAERVFKDIVEAFEALSDPRRRWDYDHGGASGAQPDRSGGFHGAGGFSPGAHSNGGFGGGQHFFPGEQQRGGCGGFSSRAGRGSSMFGGRGRPGPFRGNAARAPWETKYHR